LGFNVYAKTASGGVELGANGFFERCDPFRKNINDQFATIKAYWAGGHGSVTLRTRTVGHSKAAGLRDPPMLRNRDDRISARAADPASSLSGRKKKSPIKPPVSATTPQITKPLLYPSAAEVAPSTILPIR
jgi:hypothetical protein